jgi:hypothetical protein
MNKIEIDDLNSLIKKGYPAEYIKKIIDDVLNISIMIRGEYPDYKGWFLDKQVPGIYDGSRNIIVAHINDRVVGFANLKKDETEKKICTLYIAPSFRKNKIGDILVEQAMSWLECENPLITIPTSKLGGYIRIAHKYNWIVTDIKDGLYRINDPEVILNGALVEVSNENTKDVKSKTKSLKNIWFFYNLSRFKRMMLFKKYEYNI